MCRIPRVTLVARGEIDYSGPMPAAYAIHPDLNLVAVRYVGTVTTEESVENFIAYMVSGEARPGHQIFIDFSECTALLMDFDGMRTMVAEKLGLIDPYEATMVTAMFAPTDAVFEACETYQRLVSNSDKQFVGVFRDRGAALKFLGLPEDALTSPAR